MAQIYDKRKGGPPSGNDPKTGTTPKGAPKPITKESTAKFKKDAETTRKARSKNLNIEPLSKTPNDAKNRHKEKKNDWMDEKPSKPKGGSPDDNKGMSGGSSVPRKPGPKKPASPAAKNLQRTASRSK